jgi:putative pyruvate formate lyase activating enzyme
MADSRHLSSTIPVELHGDGRFLFRRRDFIPAYLKTYEEGRLRQKAEEALDLLRRCTVCPRNCRVNRLAGRTATCRSGRYASVTSACPHHGEEDCLRGRNGSGTIFFTGCNLRCVFCQNYAISQVGRGEPVNPHELALMMLQLQEAGCHNINLVTPEHVVPQVLEGLVIAVERGLRLPLVYNTSAYDGFDSLRLLDGVVDIYMPDFKLWDSQLALKYLLARDYPETARRSIRTMHEQVGELKVGEDGVALRGILVRHLVMPGLPEETQAIMCWLAGEVSRDTYVNVMDQYHPAWKVKTHDQYAELNRPLTRSEFTQALSDSRQTGLWRFESRWRSVFPEHWTFFSQ